MTEPAPTSGLSHQSREAGLAAFALASVIGFAAAIIPGKFARPEMTTGAVVISGVTFAAFIVILRRPWLPLVGVCVCLYYTALTLILLGDGGGNEGLLALVAIPVVACALYGPPALTITALVAATATLAVDAVMNALNVADYAQLLTVWPITGIGIAYTIHQLRIRLEHTVSEREDSIHHDAILSLIADELYSTFDGERVLSLGLQSAARLTDVGGDAASDAAFFLVDGDHATLIAAYSAEATADQREDPRIDHLTVSLSTTTNLLDAVMRHENDRLFLLDRATPVPPEIRDVLDELGVVNAIVQLVRVGETGTGLLAVTNKMATPYTVTQREQLRGLAPIVELALSRALMYEAQSTTDHLTGLDNRRERDRRLGHMPRSNRYSVLALDVDHLRAMNVALGHRAGDEMLRTVASVLRQSTRRGDVSARVGGDEFCVVLPDTDDARATVVAERILKGLRAVAVEGRRPTVSIGLAEFGSGADVAARLAAADRALGEAKRAGGDRIAHAPVKPGIADRADGADRAAARAAPQPALREGAG